jgi:hypothetical protein
MKEKANIRRVILCSLPYGGGVEAVEAGDVPRGEEGEKDEEEEAEDSAHVLHFFSRVRLSTVSRFYT